MKKYVLLTLASVFFSLNAVSQNIADNAIGLRLGDSDGFGTEINYQRAILDNNRLEFGLSWHTNDNVDSFKLAGLFQWVWQLDGNFNWYAGAGGGAGVVSVDTTSTRSDGTFLFVAGDIGIEYDFDFPLLLSLDFRPEVGFGNARNDVDFDIALGVRYQF